MADTWREDKNKQAHEEALEESHAQAPLPPHLLQEKNTPQPGGHLHDAMNHLSGVNAHTKILHLNVQREIAVTDSKPGMKPGEGHSARQTDRQTQTDGAGNEDRSRGRAQGGSGGEK